MKDTAARIWTSVLKYFYRGYVVYPQAIYYNWKIGAIEKRIIRNLKLRPPDMDSVFEDCRGILQIAHKQRSIKHFAEVKEVHEFWDERIDYYTEMIIDLKSKGY